MREKIQGVSRVGWSPKVILTSSFHLHTSDSPPYRATSHTSHLLLLYIKQRRRASTHLPPSNRFHADSRLRPWRSIEHSSHSPTLSLSLPPGKRTTTFNPVLSRTVPQMSDPLRPSHDSTSITGTALAGNDPDMPPQIALQFLLVTGQRLNIDSLTPSTTINDTKRAIVKAWPKGGGRARPERSYSQADASSMHISRLDREAYSSCRLCHQRSAK